MAESPVFEHPIVPETADIDELGHVSNVVFLRYVQELARGHSRAVGLDRAAYGELGAIFVVRRHELDYLGPAYEGDKLLGRTWIEAWGAATSTRRSTILHPDGRELLRATTTWAFVAVDTGRPRRIPASVQEAFRRPTGAQP